VDSLSTFLVECLGVAESGELLLGNGEYTSVARTTAEMILGEHTTFVIINDMKWSHIMERRLPNDKHILPFTDVLKKRNNYIHTRYPSKEIPDRIFDISVSSISGELKEELSRLPMMRGRVI